MRRVTVSAKKFRRSQRRKAMLVSWMTTNKCNLECAHCYQDAGETQERELNTEEALTMIDQIAKAGFKIMIFSGGEPLMRPDIFDLVAHASSKGLRPVFGTNGIFITEDVAQRLKQCGAMAMGISVDSLDPKKHDWFRGMNGALDRTLKGIENCKKAGLPFQLHTTVVDWNRGEICAITDFAQEIGAMAHYVFFLIPVGRGEYIKDTSLEVLQNEELLRALMAKDAEVSIDVKPTCAPQFMRVAKQMGVEHRFTRGCLAGLTYCVVGSEGIVRPCAYMTEEAGDVRQTPFDEIWRESQVFKTLRTQDYGGACGTCEYNDLCGGCRARGAYYHDGDILGQDDYCAHGQQLLANPIGL
jgi:putative heme d1 biosynthesis radical SAM protein NirJ2